MGLGLVPALIAYFFVCVWVTFSCILNDPSQNILANFLVNTLPKFVVRLLSKTLGPKVVKKFKVVTDRALLLIYMIVVLGSWSIMFTYGYTFIERSSHVSNWHKWSGYLVFIACMASWFKAHSTSPGYITERNIVRFDNYPYDGLLFVNKVCPTMGIRKLARSKYDRYTNRHVARFDHFCGWIDNTVGEENYRFFLLFLAIHVGMCLYGTIITFKLFKGEVIDKDLLNAIFLNGDTGEQIKADKYIVAHFLFMKHFPLAVVFILMAAMVFVLSLFVMFHLYIAANGMTTNEYYKWKHVKKWHKREKSRYEKALKDGIHKSNHEGSSMKAIPDVDIGCTGPTATSDSKSDFDADVLDNDVNSVVTDPGPMPVNIYNLGIVENFKEILFPRSRRPDAIARFKSSFHQKSRVEKSERLSSKTKSI